MSDAGGGVVVAVVVVVVAVVVEALVVVAGGWRRGMGEAGQEERSQRRELQQWCDPFERHQAI